MPRDMPKKRFFAKMYGWTEEQIENCSLEAWTWFPLLEEAEADAQQKRMEQEARAQRRPAGPGW